MNRLEVFKTELDYIRNPDIRKFTEEVLLKVPEYFFTIAASSSNKHHPPFSLGEGGLVRHTKVAVRIVVDILSLEMMGKYSDDEKDIVISSLILHDGAKKGIPETKHTIATHPLVMVDFIENSNTLSNILERNILDKILDCIRSHMGEFNRDYRTRKGILPKPQGKMQNIVHLADYLSSRKYFNGFDFNIVVPRENNY